MTSVTDIHVGLIGKVIFLMIGPYLCFLSAELARNSWKVGTPARGAKPPTLFKVKLL